ncbi:hypothetical protein SAMN06265795_10962 [Noviherbaspirillum humi]|uniref:Uncharacterized protein n=1 Tax=Noviherbaspirillum humi TaxID=1688639 RepID=A0A239IDE6_9BURK|nr:hypothetical protein [Noviherbaspirillum humi]SNS91670.1 hypothetical protein SAMN06265795_10962 [Noviherbaspirillum humi]
MDYIVGIRQGDGLEIASLRQVAAEHLYDAIRQYRLQVVAHDHAFQAWVRDKSPSCGFCHFAWLAPAGESGRDRGAGWLLVADNRFRERMLTYFADAPRLGLIYLNYYFGHDADPENQGLPQGVFDYIALRSERYTEVDALPLAIIRMPPAPSPE